MSREFKFKDSIICKDTAIVEEDFIVFQPSHIFGHFGAGGQMAFCDPNRELGWAYLTNYSNILHGFVIDHRYKSLEKAMYQCVNAMNKMR